MAHHEELIWLYFFYLYYYRLTSYVTQHVNTVYDRTKAPIASAKILRGGGEDMC